MSDSQDLGFTREGALGIIEQLRGGAKNRLSYDQIRLMISILMKTSSRYGVYQSYSMPTDLSVVRVRPLESSGEYYKLKEDLGPPPPDKTLGFGRCHQPGRPVGYWSLYEDTALAEVRAELGQQYLVSTFAIPKGSLLVPVGEFDYFRRTGQTYLGTAVEQSAKNYNALLDRADWHLFALFDAFLADEFIRPAMNQTDYKITSAIADILFNCDLELGNIDAIFYPSVAFREGTNFAVRGELFKSKMKPFPAQTKIVQVTDVFGYGIFNCRVLTTLKSVNPDGNISWT